MTWARQGLVQPCSCVWFSIPADTSWGHADRSSSAIFAQDLPGLDPLCPAQPALPRCLHRAHPTVPCVPVSHDSRLFPEGLCISQCKWTSGRVCGLVPVHVGSRAGGPASCQNCTLGKALWAWHPTRARQTARTTRAHLATQDPGKGEASASPLLAWSQLALAISPLL